MKSFPNETLSILFRNKSRHIFFNCKIFSTFFKKKCIFLLLNSIFHIKSTIKKATK